MSADRVNGSLSVAEVVPVVRSGYASAALKVRASYFVKLQFNSGPQGLWRKEVDKLLGRKLSNYSSKI